VSKLHKSGDKHKSGINLSVLIIIVALLAILSYALSFLFIHDASDEQELVTTKPNHLSKEDISKGDVKIITPINGSWYSTYDGAILTVDGTTFKIETPSVDNSTVIKGTITLTGNEVTFNYDSDSKLCAKIPGKYRWKIDGQKKLFFIVINDRCKSRSERMSSPWERF
jgi:hypothetical protein